MLTALTALIAFVALPIVIGVTAIAEAISERRHAKPPSG
jgi:hypothetical protein